MKRITVTGATGLIGTRLVAALLERRDEVTVLSRRPEDARRKLGVETIGWRPEAEPAPVEGLAGRDGVVHLAGESIAQRWTAESKERIRSSRELGTARLVDGLRQSEPRPSVLVSASAVGYYGARGAERLDETAPPGTGFLAEVCEAWESAAAAATELGMRVVSLRTGVLLDRADGGLARMLPIFRLGIGGPVAGGAPVPLLDHSRRPRAHVPSSPRRSGLVWPRQRHCARAGNESRVRPCARSRAAPSRSAARTCACGPGSLWRNGECRHHQSARNPDSSDRARLPVPARSDPRCARGGRNVGGDVGTCVPARQANRVCASKKSAFASVQTARLRFVSSEIPSSTAVILRRQEPHHSRLSQRPLT